MQQTSTCTYDIASRVVIHDEGRYTRPFLYIEQQAYNRLPLDGLADSSEGRCLPGL